MVSPVFEINIVYIVYQRNSIRSSRNAVEIKVRVLKENHDESKEKKTARVPANLSFSNETTET